MKILVIGLFCIFWVQKASSAPKWSNLTTFRPPVDDLGLITDYDSMDTDMDFGNGTCFNDDDTGTLTDNDSSILDLDFGHGFRFNADGTGTDLDYGFKDMDEDLPADGLSPTVLSAWLKTVNRAIIVAGLACLMRALYRCWEKQAKPKEKRPKRIWKLVSKLKPVWIPSPQPMKTGERSDVASLPDVCTLPDLLHRKKMNVEHSVAASGVGMDMSPGLSTEHSGWDKTPGPVANRSGPGCDTNCKSPSSEPEEDGSGDFPGIDPDFIRYIESFDWDTVMPQRKTSEEPEEPASQEQEFEVKETCFERGDVVPVLPTGHPMKTEVPHEPSVKSFEKPSENRTGIVVPDNRRKLKQMTEEPLVQLVDDDRKQARDDTPAWKTDVRRYLANLPEGILDAWKAKWMERWIDGQISLAKPDPAPNVPKESGKEQERPLPKKKVTFSEDVAVKRLFFGHSCPFVPKAMRKSVKIRMIGDILPLKGDGEGEQYKILRRSNKVLSLLRH